MRHGHIPHVHWAAFDHYQNTQLLYSFLMTLLIAILVIILVIWLVIPEMNEDEERAHMLQNFYSKIKITNHETSII